MYSDELLYLQCKWMKGQDVYVLTPHQFATISDFGKMWGVLINQYIHMTMYGFKHCVEIIFFKLLSSDKIFLNLS